ncbi:MAG TPA: tetratricopeptide repeat protein [Planctomycetota bacterium]|nr:tetratricopeptide repeat protein [Planctomycetota bacterium]
MESPPASGEPLPAWLRVGVPAVVFLAAFVCFGPAIEGKFLNWDDNLVLTDHYDWRGLGGDQARFAFTTFRAGHYHPLTWLTFELDYELWGEDPRVSHRVANPAGYHLVNLLLHATTATIFFFVILRLLRKSGGEVVSRLAAAAGALFFAVHPLRVESVAWITERRDVLSGCLLAVTVLAWLKWTDGGGRRWYGIALGAFALSLLSKAWGMTLPVVLLLMDVYPLGRFTPGRRAAALREKAPFFLLAVAGGVVAFIAQKHAGAMGVEGHTAVDRVIQSAYGLFFYIAKTVVPVAQSPLYELRPDFNPFEAKYAAGAAAAAALTVATILLRKRRPELLAAWAMYAVSVSPVLGLAQAGPQLVAERYTYLSCLPFAVLAAAGLARFMSRPGVGPRGPAIAAGVVIAVLGFQAWRYSHDWRNSVALWTRAVEQNGENALGWYNRGSAKLDAEDWRGASGDLSRAVELNPGNASAFINRGIVRRRLEDIPGALADFDQAIRINPKSAEAYSNRGVVRIGNRDHAGGLADLDEALRLNPEHFKARTNRGLARLQNRDFDSARKDLTEAIRINPRDPEARFIRALAREGEGDIDGALQDCGRALSLSPPDWMHGPRAEELLARLRKRKSGNSRSP